jgi:protein O-GlcNAc transferase
VVVKAAKADLVNRLGEATRYRQSGNLKAAKAVYSDILRKDADNAEVLHLLGCLSEEMGSPEQAIKLVLKAVKADPTVPAYCYNLGNMLLRQGNLAEAIRYYREAIRLKPDYAVAHNNLGRALSQTGQREAAMACFQSAIDFAPRYADPLNSLSLERKAQGDLDGAVAACKAAISIKPDFAEAHCNLGGAYLLMQKVVEAAEAYQTAVRLQPSQPMYHANLGGALLRLGRQSDAVAAFEQALRLDPRDALTRSNRILAGSYLLASAPALWQQVQAWGQLHGRPLQGKGPRHTHVVADPERRLRIGLVSADFRNHAAAYWIEPLLAGLHQGDCEVVCYSNSGRVDAVTERLKAHADAWVPCAALDDAALAERIAADGIDILVDLSSHTEGHRLLVFARQAAPLQVSWFGFPVSTGLETMQYRFTDAVMDPPGHSDAFYSEKLVRIKRFYAAYRPDPVCGEVGAGPVVRNGFVTFASFNTLSKITPTVLQWWATILTQIPDARLLVQAAGLENAELAATVQAALCANGVEPHRLSLRGWAGIEDYMRLGQEADIALDPFPFNGGVTTCHALWMGMPVITLAGDTAASRVGASILTGMGLDPWIASDAQSYVDKAVSLAKDTETLGALRASLRARMEAAGLLDGRGLAAEAESAFRAMWRTWCASRGASQP